MTELTVEVIRIPLLSGDKCHFTIATMDSKDKTFGHEWQVFSDTKGVTAGLENIEITSVEEMKPPSGFHYCGKIGCDLS